MFDFLKRMNNAKQDETPEMKKKRRKLTIISMILSLLSVAMVIFGIRFAVKGFSYKESDESKWLRYAQTRSDYHGYGFDFSGSIDSKAGDYAWLGIGGVAMAVVGVGLYVGNFVYMKNHTPGLKKKEETEPTTDSTTDSFGGETK